MQKLQCTNANYTEKSVLYRFKSLRCNRLKLKIQLLWYLNLLCYDDPVLLSWGAHYLTLSAHLSRSLFLPTKHILQTKEIVCVIIIIHFGIIQSIMPSVRAIKAIVKTLKKQV